MRRFLRRATRLAPWALLLWIVAWLAFTAWMRPLTVPDEGRYVGVAWEMMHSGDWLTPRLDGLPFFHKPPLFYWITASAMSLFGLHEGPARLASILGASAVAFGLWLFVRRWVTRRSALTTLAVLLTMPLFFIGGQFANLDMLVAGCIGCAILLLAHAALVDIERHARDKRALAGAYLALALGVLAKGLIGLLLPGLVLVVWLGALGRVRALLRLFWWPGIVLFAVVTAPWFLVMQARFPDFFHYFFVVQHFQRFAESGFNNQQPFWFYPAALLALSLPWTPWLVGLWTGRRNASPPRAVQRPVRLLMVVWLAVIVVFFSMPRSKLIGYVLPAMAPLAFLVADGVRAGVRRHSGFARWWPWTLGGAALLCVVAVVTLAQLPRSSTHLLGQTLLAQRQPAEPLIFLGDYYYDIAFYSRATGPIPVVQPWDDPATHQRDNWLKEFSDAGQFATSEAAAATLMRPSALPPALCAQPVSWIVAPRYAAALYPFLTPDRLVATQGETALWRLDRTVPALAAMLQCPAGAAR